MPARGRRRECYHPHTCDRRHEQETKHEFDRQPLAHLHVPLSAFDVNDGHGVEKKAKHRWRATDPGLHFILQHTKIETRPRYLDRHRRPSGHIA